MEAPFYRIIIEGKCFLSEMLTVLSSNFNSLGSLKIRNKLLAFFESEDKIMCPQKLFDGFWEDHPYPDEVVIVWSGMDTTKNNLGKITSLVVTEHGPSLYYSHTLGAYYIVENTPPSLLDDTTRIPQIEKYEESKIKKHLIWWFDFLEGAEGLMNTES